MCNICFNDGKKKRRECMLSLYIYIIYISRPNHCDTDLELVDKIQIG